MTKLKTTELLDRYIQSASENVSKDVKIEKSDKYSISIKELQLKVGKPDSRNLFTTAYFSFEKNLMRKTEPTLISLNRVFEARMSHYSYLMTLICLALFSLSLSNHLFNSNFSFDYLAFLYILIIALNAFNLIVCKKRKNKFKNVNRNRVELIKVDNEEFNLLAKLEKLTEEKGRYRKLIELFFESFYEYKTTPSKEALKASISIAKKIKEEVELSKELRDISEEGNTIVVEEKWKLFNDNDLQNLT